MSRRKWATARRFGEFLAPRGQVDALAGSRIAGWAFGHGPLKVEAWLGGRCIARTSPSIARPDVAHAYSGRRGAAVSGFSLDLPEGSLDPDALSQLQIIARPLQPWMPNITLGAFDIVGDHLAQRMIEAGDCGIVGPFPRQVINAIAAVWPEDCVDLCSTEGQARFVSRLKRIMLIPDINAFPVFADYARYLSTTLAHCHFVERHFPAANTLSDVGAADFHCKPNSVHEIYSIIHQLYVLKSWGIDGDFAEFGCFKGYSSAMLSYACLQLGVKMHIFDSFEGLPSAPGSGYLPGQYAGNLNEVRDHVTRFGAVDCVTFHKGFFADTFREWRPAKLMCLWMDVDLEVSARDLMVVADALDPRASLFSHECNADIFREGKIVTQTSPDNPIPPMLQRHEKLGRPLTGRYIAGYTGAFWPISTGIPVASSDIIMNFVRNLS